MAIEGECLKGEIFSVVFHEGYSARNEIMEKADETGEWNCGTPSAYGFCAVCNKPLIDDLSGKPTEMEDFILVCEECARRFRNKEGRSLAIVAETGYVTANRPPLLNGGNDYE